MDLTTGGLSWENFIMDGGEDLRVEGQEDFELEDPEISNLISLE